MNILCIIHELARNGAVVCLLDAARHFRSQGHTVTIYVDGPEPDGRDSLRREFEAAGARIILRPDGGQYDMAVVCTLLNYRWVNRLKGQLPLAWWIHEGTAVAKSMLGKGEVREAFAGADHLIFPNPNADKMFEPIFGEIPTQRRSIVPPVIAKIPPAAPMDKAPGRFRVVCVGSLCQRKRQSDLIAAMDTLTDLPIECVLIGETTLMDADLTNRLATASDRILTTGGLGAAEVHAYYASADAFCLPSADEHFPMAPLEAGLHRLPVILTSLKCYEGVWSQGQNALLHPLGDQLLLASYLRSLFVNPELRARLGQSAERLALAYTESRFSAALDLAVDATLATRGIAPKHERSESASGLGRLFGWRKKRPAEKVIAEEVEETSEEAAELESLPPAAPEIAALHDQAMALAGVGDLAAAADLLQRVLADAPRDLRGLSSATMVMTFLKDFHRAEEFGRRALDLAPRVSALHVNLGNCLFEQGRFGEALASFRRALELRPDLLPALLNCGHCYVALGQNDEAAEYFAKVRGDAPDDPTVFATLGRAYLGIDRLADAEECLSRALALDPSNVRATADLERVRAATPATRIQVRSPAQKKSLVFSLLPSAKEPGVGEEGPAKPKASEGAVEILRWQPGGRKFLVCVRAGHHSTHRDWFKDSEARNWDLLLHYYAVPPEGPDLRAEIVATGGLSKFYAAKDLWRMEPSLSTLYDAVIFMDDDISCTQKDMNIAFELFQKHGLQLGQPSLSHQSDDAWKITYCCPSFKIRFTNFIEIMMPMFSREALEQCLDSFTDSVSGYGLDFVWPHLLGGAASRVGIIDAVSFTHTKPVDFVNGAFYKYLRSLGIDPHKEMHEVLRRYSIADMKTDILGAIMNDQINGGRSVLLSGADSTERTL